MSLINKMLQDLEGRRLEGEAAGTLEGHVRAAPDPGKIHVAWWVVLGLTLVLTGGISWLWGYRTAPTTMPSQQIPQLALKIPPNTQIQPAPVPVPNTPAGEDNTDNIALVAATPIRVSEDDGTDNPSSTTAANRAQNTAASVQPVPVSKLAPTASPIAVQAPAAVAEPVPPVAPAVTPRLPALDASAARTAAGKTVIAGAEKVGAADRHPQKTDKETEFDIPLNVAKQIKEPTLQQRAEEEYRRATVLLDQGKTSESMAALEKSLQLDPQHSVARQTLAGLLLEQKRPDEAIRTLQLGLNVDKSHPALAMMLARLQVDKGQLRPAVATLQRTLPYAVERADYHAFLAALLQREGRHKQATEHYLLALHKAPQNGLWWMGIAISLQADNRPGEARDAFGRAKASGNLSPELLAFVEEKLNQLR